MAAARGALSALTAWRQRALRTRPGRAWTIFSDARGSLLAGGVAYYAFFSVFPAVALAFTVFGVLLHGHPEWLAQIASHLDEALPGFVQHGDTGLIPLTVPSGGTLSGVGLLGGVFLLWSGLGWLAALRNAFRVILGAPGQPGNAVTDRLRDLGVLVLLGLGIAVSVAAGAVAGGLAGWLSGAVGLAGQGWVVSLAGLVVSAVIDGLLVLATLRLLSGVDLPLPALRDAAVVGGLGLTALKVLGTTLIGGTLRNPLFASFALVVGLLAWLNLMSRVVLLASAWSATYLDATTGSVPVPGAPGAHAEQGGDEDGGAPEAREEDDIPSTAGGQREADERAAVPGDAGRHGSRPVPGGG